MKRSTRFLVILLALAGSAQVAAASPFGAAAFRPAVPVSAFARPSSWVDLSRLQVSAEVMVGGGGHGVDGLQVTRLQYQIADPLAVRVSLGNAFGGASRTGNGMFLEGLDLSYRPFRSMIVEFHYQDVRSALQWSRSPLYRY